MLGAVAAYLFVGISFAFIYQAMSEERPACSSRVGGVARRLPSTFFSFTTLTTTGYGNLVTRRQSGPVVRRDRDADRSAVPGDSGGQGHQRVATRSLEGRHQTEPERRWRLKEHRPEELLRAVGS